MKIQILVGISSLVLAGSLIAQTNPPAAPLTPGDPISLGTMTGGFDFIRTDVDGNRLLLGHEGNKTFDVFDLATRKLQRFCCLHGRATG
ncbi:MAG TPA: hypothetical protein VN625_04340, partial [Desulfuromonadaceae bacterium]|nr:hypothetical protein [Desulfuromonadaceae bacterium]